MALRFLGEESAIVSRERVLASLRLLLAEPKLADLVIADLARWQDWSVIDRLTGLFETATADNIFVREPIVNYLRACPLPEAAAAITKLETIDPDAVRRAATMAGLASAIAAASPPSGDGDPGEPTSPVAADVPPTAGDLELTQRIAPVLGDEDPSGADSASSPPAPSSPKRGVSWLKWLVWGVAVVTVGIMARRMLRPAPVTD
jgi:hypothetical protein